MSVRGKPNQKHNQEKAHKENGEDEKTPWHISGYTVLPNLFDDGIYISDHRAVVGDVALNVIK